HLYPPVQSRRVKWVPVAAPPQHEILKIWKAQHQVSIRRLRLRTAAEHEHFPGTWNWLWMRTATIRDRLFLRSKPALPSVEGEHRKLIRPCRVICLQKVEPATV